MARKSHYIKNLNYRDIQAIKSLGRCGYVNHNQLNTFLKDNRISNYQKEGLITKDIFRDHNNNSIVAYKLTDKGKDLAIRNGVNKPYMAQSIKHDMNIADKYFSLNEQERETWKTETEIREKFLEELERIREQDQVRAMNIEEELRDRQISMPDCSYTLETGIEVYYESITNSYGQEELQAKERAIEILKTDNTEYITSR